MVLQAYTFGPGRMDWQDRIAGTLCARSSRSSARYRAEVPFFKDSWAFLTASAVRDPAGAAAGARRPRRSPSAAWMASASTTASPTARCSRCRSTPAPDSRFLHTTPSRVWYGVRVRPCAKEPGCLIVRR